jgi:hypothetical protein
MPRRTGLAKIRRKFGSNLEKSFNNSSTIWKERQTRRE